MSKTISAIDKLNSPDLGDNLPPELKDWERMQYKSFRKWVQLQLAQRNIPVSDLKADFYDGTKLYNLLEILTEAKIGKSMAKPKTRIQSVNNLGICFEYMHKEGLRLENVGVEDIADGNLKLLMGMVWSLVLKYEIGKLNMNAGNYQGDKKGKGAQSASNQMNNAKKFLLDWLKCIGHYKNVNITDLTSSFKDGKPFMALAHLFNNNIVDYDKDVANRKVDTIDDRISILEDAFDILEEEFEVPRMLDPKDVAGGNPDEKAMMTYLASCVNALEKYAKKKGAQAGGAGADADQVDASKSVAYGPGAELASTAEPARFTIQAKNKNGNNLARGGDRFDVKIKGPDGFIDSRVKDNGNGTYTVEYNALKPGPHCIEVTHNGKPISNSPLIVEAEYQPCFLNEASHKWSEGYGAGVEIASDAEPANFTIQAKNKYGNNVTKGGDPFKVGVKGPKAAEATVKDNGDGTYAVSYRPTQAGNYVVDATLNNHSIYNSPYSVTCEHNDGPATEVDPKYSSVNGPGSKSADTLTQAQFTVTANNKYGNKVPKGGAPFQVDINGNGKKVPVTLKDNNDGTYSATYQPVSGGLHSVDVALKGTSIARCPFEVPVTQVTDPSKSVAVGAGTTVASTAEPATFTVIAKDSKGNQVVKGGDKVRVKVTDPSGSSDDIEAVIRDNGDGTYAVSYQTQKPGAHTVEVTINGKPISNGTMKVNSEYQADPNNVVDPRWTTARGAGLEAASTAEPSEFVVQARNKFGNPITKGGAAVTTDIKSSAGDSVPTKVKDNGDGTYTVSYQAKKGGDQKVEVKVGGTNIQNSPFTVPVDDNSAVSTKADPKWSTSTGAGTKSGDTDAPATYTIQSKNKYGNPLSKGGAPISVKVAGKDGKAVETSVKDNGDGTYAVAYNPTGAGDHRVVTQTSDGAQGQPIFVPITQEADASTSSIHGAGTQVASTAEPATFTIQARDRNGNKCNEGGAPFQVKVTNPKGELVDASVFDNQDGTYTCTYQPQVGGQHVVAVTLDGQNVKGSPVKVNVDDRKDQSDEADPKWSTISGAGAEIASTAEKGEFTIHAKNKYGNPLKRGGDQFRVELAGPGGLVPENMNINDNKDGTYTVSYNAKKPGLYTGDVSLKDTSIDKCPFTVTVEQNSAAATDADPYWSSLSGPGIESGDTTKPSDFTITARNKYGNKVSTGGDPFKVKVKGHRGRALRNVKPKDNKDGTYAVSYQPVSGGTHVVEVTLDGVPLRQSPVAVPVQQKTDAGKCVAKGAGTEIASTAEPARFTVQAKDAKGNNCNRGGDPFKVSVKGPSGETVVSSIRDNNDGTYSVEYQARAEGPHQVEVTLDGKPISNGVMKVTAEKNSAPSTQLDPKWSSAEGAGVELASTAEVSEFDLFPRNKYGNEIPVKAADFKVNIKAPAGSPPIEAKIAEKDGGKSYKVAYNPKVPGDHQVEVTLNGKPIFETPAKTEVEHNTAFMDEADARWSSAVNPPTKAGLKNPTVFTVQAKNKYGNPLKRGGDPFKVQSKTPSNTDADSNITDNKDGTYTVTFNPKAVGKHAVGVTLGEDPIRKSPFDVQVSEGGDIDAATAEALARKEKGASAQTSVPFGPGLDSAIVGEPAVFTVQAKDKNWKNLTSGGDPISASVTGPQGQQVPVQVKDNGNGTYTVTYTPQNPGYHKVDVALDGDSLADCPRMVLVKQLADPSKCSLDGQGISSASTSAPAVFTIRAHDKSGKPLTTGGDDFYVKVTPPPGAKPVLPLVTDNEDGTYTVTYQPTTGGQHAVEVSLDGVALPGCPVKVDVSQKADPSKCIAFGPGFDDATTGSPAVFIVQAKDSNGNNLTKGGDPFVAKLTGPAGSPALEPTVKDNGNGTYTVSVQPKTPGHHTFDVQLNGQSIANVPRAIPVRQDVSPSKCTASGSGLEKAKTSEPAEFTITARDSSGAPVTRGGDKFKVKIAGKDGAPVDVKVKDNKDGTYTATYQPYAPGPHSVEVSLNGEKIANSPVTVNVAAGEATTMGPFEMEVWRELNKARMNPAVYATNLKELLPHYDQSTGAFSVPDSDYVRQTKEGRRAVQEAIRFLETVNSCSPLKISEAFSNSCRDLVSDIGAKGGSGNTLSDGTDAATRLNRYGRWKNKVGEVLSFGAFNPRDVVVGWIVDDGVSNRPNRLSVFDPAFTVCGISSGPHATQRSMCACALAGNYVEGDEEERAKREVKVNYERETLKFDHFETPDKKGYLIPAGPMKCEIKQLKLFKEGKILHIQKTIPSDAPNEDPLVSDYRYNVPYDFDPISVTAKRHPLTDELFIYLSKPVGSLDPNKEEKITEFTMGPLASSPHEKMDMKNAQTADYILFNCFASKCKEDVTIFLKGKAMIIATQRYVVGEDEESEFTKTISAKRTVNLPFPVTLSAFSLVKDGNDGFSIKILKPTSTVSPDAQVEIPILVGTFD